MVVKVSHAVMLLTSLVDDIPNAIALGDDYLKNSGERLLLQICPGREGYILTNRCKNLLLSKSTQVQRIPRGEPVRNSTFLRPPSTISRRRQNFTNSDWNSCNRDHMMSVTVELKCMGSSWTGLMTSSTSHWRLYCGTRRTFTWNAKSKTKLCVNGQRRTPVVRSLHTLTRELIV